MEKDLVTILVITYNHIDNFANAIESVLNQKTSFRYKIIVLNDASTDGTSEVVKRYANYPNVECIIRPKNIGGVQNILEGLKLVNTKYYAILESDDYWSCETKLQEQVDILEQNPDCSFCAHNTLVNYVNESKSKPFLENCKQKYFFPKKITKSQYIEPHTSSRLYRTDCLNLEEIKNPLTVVSDISSNFYYLTKGNLFYIDKIMSVYNYTEKGIYSSISSYKQRFYSANIIKLLNEEFDYKYNYLLARFFSTRLNLSYIRHLVLKFAKNSKPYEKVLEDFEYKYLKNWDEKPIFKITIPIGREKRLAFELKREKAKV